MSSSQTANNDNQDQIQNDAKKIMKYLMDKEAHIPTTYDSEKKIFNLCLKNLKANNNDVEATKAVMMEKYKEPPSEKKTRKRSATTVYDGSRKKRRSRKTTPKTEIVKIEENRPIVNILNEMSGRYFLAGDKNRGAAYALASKIIRNANHIIKSREDLTHFHGIGEHINDHIHEFFSTGKIEKLEELRQTT